MVSLNQFSSGSVGYYAFERYHYQVHISLGNTYEQFGYYEIDRFVIHVFA